MLNPALVICWQFAAIEKAEQCEELLQALELSTVVGKAAEMKLEELLSEKKELAEMNEFLQQKCEYLEQQVNCNCMY